MKRLSSEDKAGLYVTVIVHLTVIIILLLTQISATLKRENTFVLDFTKQEEMEKEVARQQFDEEISKRLDDMIAGRTAVPFRNIAENRSSRAKLKDDRNTDADKLYEDAQRLQDDLKRGVKPESDDDFAEITDNRKNEQKEQSKKEYSGPSVLSYDLDGRRASRLPIPAYKCYGGGMVTVLIIVDRSGKVVSAKVQDELSSDDRCLREYAVKAAQMSRFSASQEAPERQGGNIVYQFLAQNP